jgi:hypothetical protein
VKFLLRLEALDDSANSASVCLDHGRFCHAKLAHGAVVRNLGRLDQTGVEAVVTVSLGPSPGVPSALKPIQREH